MSKARGLPSRQKLTPPPKDKWLQLTVNTTIRDLHPNIAFSLLKNILARAKYRQFFYTTYCIDKKFVIILRFNHLENPKEVLQYLEKDDAVVHHSSRTKGFTHYQREHILPLIIRASEFTIAMDILPADDALFYLLHCIAMTCFLSTSSQARIYLELLDDSKGKLFDAYLEKEEAQ